MTALQLSTLHKLAVEYSDALKEYMKDNAGEGRMGDYMFHEGRLDALREYMRLIGDNNGLRLLQNERESA